MQTTIDRIPYLLRLEDAARHAFQQWGKSCDLHGDAVTEFSPNRSEVSRLENRCNHQYARFHRLQTRLASLLNLSPASVYNALSTGRLLAAYLPVEVSEPLLLAA